MRRLVVLGAGLLTLALGLWTAPGRADDAIPVDFGPSAECLGAVPYLSGNLGGDVITADVVIARDGVTEADARRVTAAAAKVYVSGGAVSPNIKLNIVAVHDVTGKFESSTVTSNVVESDPSGSDLMSELIRHYRKNYPKLQRDHVHLITTKDIGYEGSDPAALVGQANCLGSIGSEYSYSVAEFGRSEPFDLIVGFQRNVDSIVIAHEIGHAFGAHHHYANCAETAFGALAAGEGNVCSVMINDVSLMYPQFSAFEASAVRGFAEAHLG